MLDKKGTCFSCKGAIPRGSPYSIEVCLKGAFLSLPVGKNYLSFPSYDTARLDKPLTVSALSYKRTYGQ